MLKRREKVIFDKKLLDKYILENNVKLNKEYESTNRETVIEFICDCGKEHSKTFRQIVNVSGAFCHDCTIQRKLTKAKITLKEKYNVENPGQMENHVEKMKEANLKNFGYEFASQSPEIKEKVKETNLERFGYEFSSQSPEMKERIKHTNIKNLGVPYPMQSPKVQEKLKENNLKKYGYEYYFQIPEIIEKLKETYFKNFGVRNPFESEVIKEKIKQTNLSKYGYEFASQSPEIYNKILEKSLSRKEYIMPSGKIRYIQGYENFALRDLVKEFEEDEIITDFFKIPVISYIYEEKDKVYYPDIFIPKINKIIEVKSKWTFEKDFNKNMQKEKAVKEHGYLFEFWIYDEKGNKKVQEMFKD